MPNVNETNTRPTTEKAQLNELAKETKAMEKPEKKTTKKEKTETKKTVKKTTRKKSRPVNELIEAATKNMTDKEKEHLIDFLKNEIVGKNTKIEALRINSEKAYEQARELEKQYTAMEEHYRQKLQYIDEQSRAFLKAVTLSTRGGLN